MLDTQNELRLMNDFDLTAEELLFIELFYCYKMEPNYENTENLRIFKEELNVKPMLEIIKSLMEKRVLEDDDVVPMRSINDYDFRTRFLNKFSRYTTNMGEELFALYPAEIFFNGSYFKAKNISKRFASFNELCYFYGKEIKFNADTHSEIIEILEWAKENNRLFYGIVEFVVSHKWLELKDEMINGYNNDYINTVQVL